jgi:hypothetical protein
MGMRTVVPYPLPSLVKHITVIKKFIIKFVYLIPQKYKKLFFMFDFF